MEHLSEKLSHFMSERVAPIAEKLSSSKYLQTISQSMMSLLTPLILGSFAVLLLAFPIEAVQNMVQSTGLAPVLSALNTFTIGGMALYVAFLMGKNLVEKLTEKEDGTLAGVFALMSFLLVTPLSATADEVTALPTTWLGAQGVFSAMIIGLVVGRIYTLFRQKNWSIKMPDSVPPMVTRPSRRLFRIVDRHHHGHRGAYLCSDALGQHASGASTRSSRNRFPVWVVRCRL